MLDYSDWCSDSAEMLKRYGKQNLRTSCTRCSTLGVLQCLMIGLRMSLLYPCSYSYSISGAVKLMVELWKARIIEEDKGQISARHWFSSILSCSHVPREIVLKYAQYE